MIPIIAFQKIQVYALRGYDTSSPDEKDLFFASILDVLREIDKDRIESEALAAETTNVFSLTDYRKKKLRGE